MTLILRGHHLLCLQGFQGYGYDATFVENMAKVNEKRKDPETKIKLTQGPDDLCTSCPNLKDNLCQNTEEDKKISSMDKIVLEKIPKKDIYDSEELFEYVNEAFSTPESIKNICFNCKWWDVCIFVRNIENR